MIRAPGEPRGDQRHECDRGDAASYAIAAALHPEVRERDRGGPASGAATSGASAIRLLGGTSATAAALHSELRETARRATAAALHPSCARQPGDRHREDVPRASSLWYRRGIRGR